FQACTECGVKKVIQISALGADETAFSTYHLTKRRADDVLRTLDIDWTILRPSVVYGNGAKSMALFRAMAALPLIPLPGKGEQTLQPVSIDDLIQVVLNVLNAKIPARQTIDLIGPESLTLQQLYRQLRQWLGLGKARFINLPWRVTLIMAWLTGLFSRSVFNLQSMQMLQRGYTLPPASTTHHIIQTQTRLTDALSASVCNPAEYQVARLRFVLPLLRISIALLWIWTGLVSIFFFPVSESYALLAQFNLHGMQADLALYGGALLDFICGLALLLNYRSKQVYALMLLIMTAYTVLITLALPAFWLHPFGPISKNFPLFIATLLLMVTEEPRYGLSPA
ncbi:MAG: SDR family oxidoreductase, partial [Gammaproteobacteria bacterium]|nr:SDR family oxidoreductase [Gammaproteobacteria bacterium]